MTTPINPGGIPNFTVIQDNVTANTSGKLTTGTNKGKHVSLAVNAVDVDANGNPLAAVGGVVESLQMADSGTAVSTVAFASGTAVKNTSAFRRTYSIATATAGTGTVVITDPNGNNTTLVTSKVLAAVDLLQFNIGPGWSVKVTLVTSTGATNWEIF